MDADDDWREGWVVDEDADAAAQAVHSSGFAVSIFRLREPGGCPRWVAEPAKHYEAVERRLHRQMGDEAFAAFLADRCAEALQLWQELGYRDGETRHPGPRPDPLPCKLISWRSKWKISDDPPGALNAVHSSGFAFNLVYTDLDDPGGVGWQAVLPLHLEAKAELLRAEIGDEAFAAFIGRLVGECQLLWVELGYTDESPHRCPPGGAA